MIPRINLIEKKRFSVSYGTLFATIGGILLFCLLVYGLLWLGSVRTQGLIKTLQADIERLKKEREQIINQQTTFRGEGPYLTIQILLEKTPIWSDILQATTHSLPPRVWLASIKTTNKGGTPPQKEMILNGKAKSPQAVAAFLAHLEQEPTFEKVVLTTSAQEPSGEFNFTITCDIGAQKRWTLRLRPSPESKF